MVCLYYIHCFVLIIHFMLDFLSFCYRLDVYFA